MNRLGFYLCRVDVIGEGRHVVVVGSEYLYLASRAFGQHGAD